MIHQLARLINRNVHWALIPIAALLLFPSPWMSIGFIAALGLFLCRWAAVGSPFVVSQANLPLVVLLVMTAVGLAISPAPDLAVITAGQVIASVTIFFVLLDRFHAPADLWRGAAVMVVLGILFALIAPFTVEWTPQKLFDVPVIYEQEWPRLDKVTNPNILGGGLALIVPIALALLGQSDRRWRALGAVSLVPMGVTLVLLQSRGAWFGLILGLGVWATLHWRWVLPLLPLGLIAGFAFNSFSGGPSPAEFVYGKVGISTTHTFVERQDLWYQSLFLLRGSPLTGIGLGAYPRIAPDAPPYSPSKPGPVENHTHNLFLQVALDTGLVGLGAFVVMVALAVRGAWQAYRDQVERSLAIGILASFVVLIAHGMGDVIVWGTAKPSILLWMLLSLGLALDQICRTVKREV